MSSEGMDPMAQMLLKMLFHKWASLIDEGHIEDCRRDISKAIAALEEEES